MFAFLLAALLFGDLHYRAIGPAVMGGRLDALAAVPGDPSLVYVGHASGGLWKSTDGGLTFASIFDAGTSSAIGALALDPRDARRVYAGTGEPFPRNTAQAGDGIWMTRDGGAHWRNLGLRASGSIARIAIDPRDPRTLLVAAMGNEYAPSAQRGIFRSTDGGAHWTRTLFVNGTTGGSDLAVDPRDPRVVYAGMYDFLRTPWHFRGGGPGSGLYRSRDGGSTWTRLSDPHLHNGLPSGPFDRIGVSICASDPRVVYALIPNRQGLLYASTDGGAHWQARSKSSDIDSRPYYFSQVRCDPRNPRIVYSLSGALMRSTDGGRTFHDLNGGGDNHDLWIDPRNPKRLLDASDMGFAYSLDGGRDWDADDVVPFAQVYRVGYDDDLPYHVMGGLQDHEVWWGPNTLFNQNDGASNGSWRNIADWGDGQYALADPLDPNVVYEDTHFGDLARVNLATGQRQYISPAPIIRFGGAPSAYRYRFNWSAPLAISHFDPNVLYFGGNVLFRSPDGGASWLAISPDLTHCDGDQLRASGGPVEYDDTNAETYCTIVSIAQDAADSRTIWFGTDNGHLERTRDLGRTWSDLTGRLPNLPLPARIASIAASPSQSGTVLVCADRHQWNDDRAYVYVTRDFGATWQSIGAGLRGFVHVVREDPRNPDLLYAGTEQGIFASFDGGEHWTDLRLGLPHVPIFDLQVQPRANDLILGSHGRGFFILDDLTPLQQWSATQRRSAYLFPPMPAVRYNDAVVREHPLGAFVAPSKPYGLLLSLYLANVPRAIAPHKRPRVLVRISQGARQVDAFQVPVHTGVNRFTWDLRVAAPGPYDDVRPYYVFYTVNVQGPQVLPGSYTVSVDLPHGRLSVPASVLIDPREHATATGLKAQFDALQRIARVQERAERAVTQLRRAQRVRPRPEIDTALARLQNASGGYRSGAELIEQLAYLRHTIEQFDGAPTAAQEALIDRYAQEMDAIEKGLPR